MEIILLERIEKLGQMGDVVTVKNGYARNFLLPGHKAIRATKANKAEFDNKKSHLEADNLDRRKDAEAVAAKMEGLSLILVRQAGDSGQLYGSVASRDIAEITTAEGFTISRSQVVLEHPIKSLGFHKVTISLHPEVTSEVSVNVARSIEEAKIQAETGQQVRSQTAQDEADEAAALAAQAEKLFDEGAAPEVEEEAESSEAESSEAETETEKAETAEA